MAKKADKTKEQLIKSERTRLNGIFKELDANQRKVVKQLIDTAAFLSVSLVELQDQINREGYTDEYKNGQNQFGTKTSEAVKTHIAMTKNLTTIIKQLADMCPPERKKESRLAALMRE